MEETLILIAKEYGQRIDKFITDSRPDLTRSFVQKIIENENVQVNEKNVKSNYKVKIGDCVHVLLEEPKKLSTEAENIPLDIVYEDDSLLVINKPKGMVVHPGAGHFEGTLVNALMYHCKDSLSGIGGVMRPGIVHRIDKDTSGLLLVAKTNEAHLGLSLQLKDHEIVRTYNAVVCGRIKEDEGTVDQPIGRHPTLRKQMCVTQKNSRRAVTHFRVLERFSEYTLVECVLETGRTHQIRVHMAYLGHPILGDSVYGFKKQKINAQGQTLHAKSIRFFHPIKKETMLFETPLPEYFEEILRKIQ